MIEARSVFRRRRFRRAKANLLLSAMRHRAAELGDRVTYVRADTYREALDRAARGRPVGVHHPTSHPALRLVRSLRQVRGTGWTHRIPRLVVLGSLALRRSCSAAAITDSFHHCLVLGYDWVMLRRRRYGPVRRRRRQEPARATLRHEPGCCAAGVTVTGKRYRTGQETLHL
ncbi:hypothetical protein GCM10010297_12700 [Streptomyces malachitofuscus]|nr:hypothetical protein GCM10010297_12700 [Streptomyces malachitofuscus]